MDFKFKEQGGVARIEYDGQPIIQMDQNYFPFKGALCIHDQVMLPGERSEVAYVCGTFATHGYNHAVTEVKYETEKLDDGITVRIIPTNTKSGREVFEIVNEILTFTVRLIDDRFVWTQHLKINFKQDLVLEETGNHSTIRVYRFPKQDGSLGRFLQFADPMPRNASGPAVPMTRDWIGVIEPTVGPDTFRAHWKRDYDRIIFQDPDHSYSWTELNRAKTHAMVNDNQRARPCDSKGTLYLVKDNNDALEYSCDVSSHYHHICEWGMDYHCWLDAGDYAKDGVIAKGTVIEAATTVKLVGSDVIEPVLKSAKYIDLTEREKFHFNLPAYEEPENTFTKSVLESHCDAQHWQPTSEGCSWQKDGGYKPDTGCLVIHNNFSQTGSWIVPLLGPSHWCNPFDPGAQYRMSAWVKLEDMETMFGGPSIGIEFTNYHGLGTARKTEKINGGQASLDPFECPQWTPNREWTYLEFITCSCPSYVLRSTMTVKLEGYGKAYFSNIRWELIK